MLEKNSELSVVAGLIGLSADSDLAAITAKLKTLSAPTATPAVIAATSVTAEALQAQIALALVPLTAKITSLETQLNQGNQAAIDAKRDTLVLLFAQSGKAPKKVDGTAYTAEELKTLSVDTLQLLHANTPETIPLSARNGHATEKGGQKKSYKDANGRVDLAAIFDDEPKVDKTV